MKKIILLLLLTLSACGSSSEINSSTSLNPSANTQASLTQAKTCLQNGDIACAQQNYCTLSNAQNADVNTQASCCVSQFFSVLTNANTQSLASLMGYSSLQFRDLQSQSVENLVAAKKIIFGELFLKSWYNTPKLENLAVQWGTPLLDENVSTVLLNEKIRNLGNDLESVHACLQGIDQPASNISLEGMFVGDRSAIEVTPKDFYFAKFATGFLAYGLQGVFSYDWGFEQFPSLPLNNSFYNDINGFNGNSDKRFGDLDLQGSNEILSLSSLLQNTFADWDLFNNAFYNPNSLVDRWLPQRLSAADKNIIQNTLNAISISLKTGQAQSVAGQDWHVNFASLLNAEALPKAQKLPSDLLLLYANSQGKTEINWDYLEELVSPILY